MRRLLAALALVVAAFGAGVLDPVSVIGCTCQPLHTLQDWVDEHPDWGLVVGQVARDRGDGSYEFAVARWYGGSDRRPGVVVRSSAMSINGLTVADSCGGSLTVGRRLLFYGTRDEDDQYRVGFCTLIEDPESDRGQALERHAAELIGPAEEPQIPVDLAPPAATRDALDIGVVGAGIVGAVVLLFAGVVVLGLRRRNRPT